MRSTWHAMAILTDIGIECIPQEVIQNGRQGFKGKEEWIARKALCGGVVSAFKVLYQVGLAPGNHDKGCLWQRYADAQVFRRDRLCVMLFWHRASPRNQLGQREDVAAGAWVIGVLSLRAQQTFRSLWAAVPY